MSKFYYIAKDKQGTVWATDENDKRLEKIILKRALASPNLCKALHEGIDIIFAGSDEVIRTIGGPKMNPENTHYLGDGLYAHFDGFQIQLFAEREGGRHSVYLEKEVYESLKSLAKLVGWEK